MALTTGQQALAVTSVQVRGENLNRTFLEVKNADAAISVYLGAASTVTTATGHLLKAGEAFDFQNMSDAVWMIAASGTPTVTWAEFSR